MIKCRIELKVGVDRSNLSYGSEKKKKMKKKEEQSKEIICFLLVNS